MTFFTGQGDQGTTKIFGCNKQISKSSAVAEALGSLDEANSFLGVGKACGRGYQLQAGRESWELESVLHDLQEGLFIVQAQVAGADKRLTGSRIKKMEKQLRRIERALPPITSFLVPGGDRLSAHLDVARVKIREAERRVVAVAEEGKVSVPSTTLAYLNRLSSLLYALVRLVNHQEEAEEKAPTYK